MRIARSAFAFLLWRSEYYQVDRSRVGVGVRSAYDSRMIMSRCVMMLDARISYDNE